MINNMKDTGFQDLESGINSNNISSGHLIEQEHGISNGDQIILDPTLELHQLNAIRQKRDIFDKTNQRALNQGHKADVTEDDCLVSNQSAIRSDPQASLTSLSQKFTVPRNNRSSQNILTYSKFGKEDSIFQSNQNISPLNAINKQSKRLEKYQTLVKKLEEDEEQKEKLIRQNKKEGTDVFIKQFSNLQSKKSLANKEGLNIVWKNKGFQVIRFVSRFIQQLKTKTERIKFRLLTFRIFSVIGDVSANFDYILINRWIKQKPSFSLIIQYMFQNKAKNVLIFFENLYDYVSINIKVIKPDSYFKIIWDIILLLFIIINIFYIPIYISFEIYPNGIFEWLFDLLPSWIFIAEILLNFNTAYYDKGLMHEDRKSIIKHYVKGNFIWDLIVVVPFLMSYLDIPFVRYTLLLRLTRLSSLMNSIEEVLNLEENLQIIVDLLKLVFFLLITGHFCGCAWHFVAMTEYQTYNIQVNWLTRYEPDAMEFEWFDRYIIALYWSVITTVTVGYGDIVPVTTFERIFVIIVTLIICGVFGYCISNIGNIFKQMSEKKDICKAQIRNIHQYLGKRGLSNNLQLKVKKYFEYFFLQDQEEEKKTKEYISNLTKHLREEVLTDIYSKSLMKSRFFKENFESSIPSLCQHVTERTILPEQLLFTRNDRADYLYVVMYGGLEQVADHQNEDELFESTQTHLKKFTQGQIIGEREFITQKNYDYQVRALKFTSLIQIDYKNFIKVLKEDQNQFEKFCLIRDNLLFNPLFKGFGQICEVCEWTHNFIQCPFVFLQPNKNKIASKFTSTQTNKRLLFPYRSLPKMNCKRILQDINEGALSYILNNNIMTEKQITDEYLQELGFQLNIEEDTQTNNKKNSFLRNQQNSTDQPQLLPSIQTVEQKSQSNTAFFIPKGESKHNNNLNNSIDQKESQFDWDQGSQLRKSVQKIRFQSFDRGKTIQSIKSRHQVNNDLDESMVQEENKIQSMNFGSQNFISLKLKMNKSKHNISGNNNANNSIANLRKVSWLDCADQFTNNLNSNSPNLQNNSSHLDSLDNRSAKKSYHKQMSKVSEMSDTPHEQIKQRMEARENSLISKKQSNAQNDITRRIKKRKTTNIQLNCSIMSGIEQQFDTRSQRKPDKSCSGVFTQGMNSLGRLRDQDVEERNSIAVANSELLIQKRLLEIIHEHVEFDLDIQFNSEIYFPDMNVENVIERLYKYYQKLHEAQMDEEMKEMKRTKTNLTLFDRIKNKTQIRTFQDKSFQD